MDNLVDQIDNSVSMSKPSLNSPRSSVLIAILALGISTLQAQVADRIGILALRQLDPSLCGSNVVVGQAEGSQPVWQVNPTVFSQPIDLVTWRSGSGSATTFPNALGSESSHANEVGRQFYGVPEGVAPGIAHLDNYEAGYFYGSLITQNVAIDARVVNQSFIFDGTVPSSVSDTRYDNYVSLHNTLFVSAAGNGGPVSAPATCWNGIGVGAYGGYSSAGPTADGRSKPDITAPANFTSYASPQVAGAAAILLQAGARGDGGPSTIVSATNAMTVKALLLNGATKTVDWYHTPTAPLDQRFGAGILNVYRSYLLLRGGQVSQITSDLPGAALDSATNTVSALRGWDLSTIATPPTEDRVHHYHFDLPGNVGYTATATLVWNRHVDHPSVNNLDLVLRRVENDVLMAASISTVDNVEHAFAMGLPPGRYDLQVVRRSGVGNWVSASETYALAFEFAPEQLLIERQENLLSISWQTSSVGLILQGNGGLEGMPWTNIFSGLRSSNHYQIFRTEPHGRGFFRLVR